MVYDGGTPRTATTRTITVDHRGGDEFAVGVRGHVVVVDQPTADGGGDAGPSPTELFVASLAVCVAFYARRYLARHQLPTGGLRVTAAYEMSVDRPARVSEVDIAIAVPDGVPTSRLDALRAVASHCTVHNSIVRAPRIGIHVGLSGGPATG